jgi:CHRD domain
MSKLLSWLKRKPLSAKAFRRIRPHFEILEDRLVPAVFNVNSTADILNPPAGIVTLRSAIQAANATPGSNTINLTVGGTYKITIPGAAEDNNATGDFDIIPNVNSAKGSSLSIINTSGKTVIVDGNHLDRVFDIDPGDLAALNNKNFTVIMKGFTIQNGVASPGNGLGGAGGGIRDQGAVNLTLTNMAITKNSATGDGGGISNAGSGAMTIINSTIRNNSSGDNGGGIQEGVPSTSITNTEIDGNDSGGAGGGLFANGTTLLVQSTTFYNNLANGGGGAIELETTGTGPAGSQITNSTIAHNNAAVSGGGIDLSTSFTGNLRILNDTINADAATNGGGIFYAGGGNVSMENTIVAGNFALVGPDVSTNQLFVANLNGANQVPPTVTPATGTVFIIFNADQSAITIFGSATGLLGGVTAAHLHNGAAGVNGPVAQDVNGANIDYTDAQGGSTNPTFPMQTFSVDNNTVHNPGGFINDLKAGKIYTNIHTTALPSGEIRGQFIGSGGTFSDAGGNLIGKAGHGSGNTVFTNVNTLKGSAAHPLDPLLGPLQNNGGPVISAAGATITIQTEALKAGSPAIGQALVADGTFDIGAFETFKLPLVRSKRFH